MPYKVDIEAAEESRIANSIFLHLEIFNSFTYLLVMARNVTLTQKLQVPSRGWLR